jgi:hypothetical protein
LYRVAVGFIAQPHQFQDFRDARAILLRSHPAAFRLNATFCATVRVHQIEVLEDHADTLARFTQRQAFHL